MQNCNEKNDEKEFTVEKKKALYEEHSGQKMTLEEFNQRKVKCIHCDDEYYLKEFSVYWDQSTDEKMILCKNFPDCDGSMIDFM